MYRASIFNEFKIPGLSKINMFQDQFLCLCFSRKSSAERLMETVTAVKLIVNCNWVVKFVAVRPVKRFPACT